MFGYGILDCSGLFYPSGNGVSTSAPNQSSHEPHRVYFRRGGPTLRAISSSQQGVTGRQSWS